MSKKKLTPLEPGAICRMEALSGFNYWWIGKFARVVRCTESNHTRSRLSVDFEPIGWEIAGNDYKGWDRGWFTQVLPALGARRARPKGAVRPRNEDNGAKRTPERTGRKATPKNK